MLSRRFVRKLDIDSQVFLLGTQSFKKNPTQQLKMYSNMHYITALVPNDSPAALRARETKLDKFRKKTLSERSELLIGKVVELQQLRRCRIPYHPICITLLENMIGSRPPF